MKFNFLWIVFFVSYFNLQPCNSKGINLVLDNSTDLYLNAEFIGLNMMEVKDSTNNEVFNAKSSSLETIPLEEKDFFKDSYPRAFFFRRPEQVNAYSNYNSWNEEFLRLDGICSKAMNEEIVTLNHSKNQEYFNQFSLDHPEQVVILHYNGRSRDPNFRIDKFFAGHWIYHPGCLLTQDISPEDEYINVEDASLFKLDFGLSGIQKDDDIVIVPIDESGNKLWNLAEQATLISIDGNTLRIERGKYGTTASSFSSGSTYIAPHMVEGPWGTEVNNLMWYYNFSSTCPVDENGKNCGDVLSEEIAGWLSESGELHGFDGIQFDVSPWCLDSSPWGRSADIDTDGEIDYGKVDNLNVYGVGVYDFYKKLRSLIGDQKIIAADGGMADSQRAVDILNAMEAEGLSAWNHVYKEFSKPVSLFSYWKENSKYPDCSYITHKDKLEGGYLANRERLVIGAAQCLGLGVNTLRAISDPDGFKYGLPDELIKGNEREIHWLGKPVGNMVQMSDLAEDQLQAGGFSSFITNFEESGCMATFTDSSVRIVSTGESENMILRLKNVQLPSGDATVFFESIAFDSLEGFNPIIPRQIFVSLPGSIPNENTAEKVLNYTGTNKFYPCSFYYRAAGEALCDIEIEIEGEGEVELKNLKLFNEPQALCREFENGVVLVNPSLNYYQFDLKTLFPGHKFKRLTTLEYNNENVNDGSVVGDKVTLPPIDGLFLIKDGTQSLESQEIEGQSISIYPNPAGTFLDVNYSADYCGNISMKIFDFYGRVMEQRVFNKIEYHLEAQISLQNYSPGMYICSFESAENSLVKKSFIRL